MKVLLTICCNRIYSCNSLIKVSAIIHYFLLVWRLSNLSLNILNCGMTRALSRLLMGVSSWRWCLLILWIVIYLIGWHRVTVHHSAWVHIVLYNLLACLNNSAVIIVYIMIFSAFWGFFWLLYFNICWTPIWFMSYPLIIISLPFFWACLCVT